MKARPVHYEPHPVSRERKKELQAEGVRIVDSKFAPTSTPVAKATPSRKPSSKGVQ